MKKIKVCSWKTDQEKYNLARNQSSTSKLPRFQNFKLILNLFKVFLSSKLFFKKSLSFFVEVLLNFFNDKEEFMSLKLFSSFVSFFYLSLILYQRFKISKLCMVRYRKLGIQTNKKYV